MVVWEFQIQRNPHNNTYHQPKSRSLTQVIFNQEKDFSNYDVNAVKEIIKEVKQKRETDWEEEVKEISELVDPKLKLILELGQEKGSRAWLNALPIHLIGYTLNKQEFRDSVCLR